MAVKPVVYDDSTKKHRPLGSGEKMDGLSASSIISSQSGNLITTGSDGLAYATGSGIADPSADNLLEATPSGKLKMDVDRLAEWLDGHPADAKTLSEAIKVVSGDSGNVISKGTDKGAYLSKGDIAAAVAGMTDAQKAQLADAIAARIASDIADGTTIVASGGKLHSDPTNATAAQKKAINQALADADSGLVVDNSTGKLQVDFSQMPTDKFEALLKSLDMLIPLRANLALYVGLNGSDTVVDGRGSQNMPFRTIGAAAQYVASTYNIGSHIVTIYVMDGDYGTASTTLPSVTATTGVVYVRGLSGNRNTVRTGSFKARSAGANYYIVDLTATHHNITTGIAGVFEAGNGGYLHLRNVAADLNGVVGDPGSLYGFYAYADGAIEWWAFNDEAQTGVFFTASSSSRIGGVMYAQTGGQISFAADVSVSGTFSVLGAFAVAANTGMVLASNSANSNPGRTPVITSTGTVTGRRYSGSALGIIQGRGTSETGPLYYPGSEDGVVVTGAQYTIIPV